MTGTIIDTPFIEQMPELPRGCEVTSLAMLLQHAGLNPDKMQLAREVTKVPFKTDGLHGHLNDGFVGDMYSFETDGLGVYYQPIIELGEKYLPGKMINLTGCELDDIFSTVKNGLPVWVITNDTFAELEEKHFQHWQTKHGELAVTYRMHSVLVTGFDEDNVYINDPLHDKPNRPVPRSEFEKAWVQLGRQALSYKK
ncbi:C39 family peptidase [Evansella sp. LMS18]|uniref:C39 family peptidase n=1 Tax=Evansella sp. LMS18 TaxID=2924033 RepID=UPI0020D0E32C|nr:C39 family peptidase [Evansella sp. LMS18]UTR12815.1 C39 family peptidase [Evansella sp. LMS18]